MYKIVPIDGNADDLSDVEKDREFKTYHDAEVYFETNGIDYDFWKIVEC